MYTFRCVHDVAYIALYEAKDLIVQFGERVVRVIQEVRLVLL